MTSEIDTINDFNSICGHKTEVNDVAELLTMYANI